MPHVPSSSFDCEDAFNDCDYALLRSKSQSARAIRSRRRCLVWHLQSTVPSANLRFHRPNGVSLSPRIVVLEEAMQCLVL